jgi:peroxiredoxin
MRIVPQQPAVPFTVETAQGELVSLRQFSGRPLLLMFMRFASCAMCEVRLHDFAEHYPRLRERGLEAIAFFHSTAPRIRAHAGKFGYPFHLAADPEMLVYRGYGVETSWPRLLRSMARPEFYQAWVSAMRHGFLGGADWQMAKMPADFLIGPDGRVARVHYGRDIGDHLPVRDIEAALNALPVMAG